MKPYNPMIQNERDAPISNNFGNSISTNVILMGSSGANITQSASYTTLMHLQ